MSEGLRVERFNEWLRLSEGQALVWGETDCTSWPRRAVEFWTGERVACPDFSSRKEALRLVRLWGGLLTLWERALESPRFEIAYDMDGVGPFDVGIVATGDGGERGCLFASPWLAYWVGETGISPFRPAHVVKAWHVR